MPAEEARCHFFGRILSTWVVGRCGDSERRGKTGNVAGGVRSGEQSERCERDQPLARLHPDDLRQLAREVARALRDKESAEPLSERLVDAKELAWLLSVSPRWVREHAALLGGVRLPGSDDTPRWRFDPIRARAALTASRSTSPAPALSRRRQWRDVPLLPVKDDD